MRIVVALVMLAVGVWVIMLPIPKHQVRWRCMLRILVAVATIMGALVLVVT